MLALVPVFATLFGFTGLGFLLKGFRLLPHDRVRQLNWLALNVTLPALLIASLHASPALAADLLWLPLASWLTLAVGSLLVLGLVLTILRLPAREAGSLFLPSMMANTTFVGYPAISALLGAEGLLRAIFYDQLANGIFFMTFGVAIAQWAGAGSRIPLPTLIKRVLSFPPLWGMIVGFVVKEAPLPEILFAGLEWVGGFTVPFFLLGLGASLEFSGWRRTWPGVAAICAFKLLVLPLLGYGIYRALPLAPLDLNVATMQAAMPSGLFSMSLAIAYQLDEELVVNAVAATMVLSAVTLPLWAWLLGLR